MLRIVKELLIIPLIFSLAFSSILCCCLSQLAQAQDSDQHIEHAVQASESSHCESHNPQDSHSGKKHNCECPQLQGTLAKNFDGLKAIGIVLYSFKHQVVLGKIFLVFIPDSHNLFTGPSPPQLVLSSVPLYIKNPTLRI